MLKERGIVDEIVDAETLDGKNDKGLSPLDCLVGAGALILQEIFVL